MALQALKETKTVGAVCRLSPPNSPTRRSNSHVAKPFKSRILSVLDGELDITDVEAAFNATHAPPKAGPSQSAPMKSTRIGVVSATRTQMHPMFVKPKQPKMFPLDSLSAPAPIVPPAPAKKPASKRKTVTKTTEASSATAEKDTGEPFSYKDCQPEPAVVYTCHEEEANDLVQNLRGPIGFDMEWRVMFHRNILTGARRTAVVQLCDKLMILIVQVSAMKKFPQKVKEVIEDPSIVKTGANIHNDGVKLFQDFGIEASNLVELGGLAHQADPAFASTHSRKIVSLAKMTNLYCDNKVLSKGPVRVGNWEARPLSEEQLFYAANDAYAAWLAHRKLTELAAQNGVTLDSTRFTSAVTTALQARALVTPEESETDALASLVLDNAPPRPQEMRAYTMWHKQKLPLKEICALLRSKDNPLADCTVISYVIGALQADTTLPYSMAALKDLVQLEAGSWVRHRDWILRQVKA